ncbi:MAG: dihydropteroate synthase [Desulfobacteraceae bacterium]|nr:MAG: dihydropteroate synthase [Desulfobacteraceae bacterium]
MRTAQTILNWSGHELKLGERTQIMGVLNVTPDSFSDGGRFLDRDRAIEQGLNLAREGADIIDIGGESTRPYSRKVTAREEIERVVPVIKALAGELTLPISIDTFKAEVAQKALEAGAAMINDISSLRFDPDMAAVAAKARVPVILMHIQGTPADMQNHPTYQDLMAEIVVFLQEAIERAVKAGIQREMLLVDPGIGFGKTFDHNLEIIRELGRLLTLQQPILLGSSRKAFIGHILNKEAPERDLGTMATIAAGILNGAQIVRVHNVAMALQTVKIVDAIKRGRVEEERENV